GVEACGLLDTFRVGRDVAAGVPDAAPNGDPRNKFSLPMRRLSARRQPGFSLPTCLVFAEIVPEAQSRIEPVDNMESVVRLADQTNIVAAATPAVAARQLGVCRQLAEQCQAVRLLAGSDVKNDPAAAASMLRTAASHIRQTAGTP